MRKHTRRLDADVWKLVGRRLGGWIEHAGTPLTLRDAPDLAADSAPCADVPASEVDAHEGHARGLPVRDPRLIAEHGQE
jgi:hypothetical protein